MKEINKQNKIKQINKINKTKPHTKEDTHTHTLTQRVRHTEKQKLKLINYL